MLYNDSSAYSFHSFFDSRINSAKHFEQILEIKEELRAVGPAYDGIFEQYYSDFGYGFKLSGNAVARVLKRVVP
jgi:hypothetical protein